MTKEKANRRQATAKPKENSLPHLRVLVVDDEPAVRQVLAHSLGQRGFSVLTASDLRSAVDAAKQRPDVILLDVRLGSEDGLQLVKILQGIDLAIPIVVLTGHAGPYEGFKARELGVANLVEKPSSPDEIGAALRRAVIQSHTANAALRADAPNPAGGEASIPGSGRTDRVSRVLTGLLSGPADVHSIESLCELAPIGVAPSTFRRWCHDLSINPARVVEFARLLRAITWAATHGLSPRDGLDMDLRTFDKVLHRGGLTELFAEQRPTWREFIRSQKFIRNRLLLNSVEKHCCDLENRVRKDQTR